MVKYLNSPLKIAGSIIAAAGISIAAFSLGQLMFLGISVISLGILVHVTAWIIYRSQMKQKERKVFEFCLLFFILTFCATLLLDYLGIIRLDL
ncbi:MAG: hypothetical protein C5B52_11560 [Bacteroidetes bacterium]|nr:MAG: hypothetical protein C5B52_11560 [Bacteroidota bacterium]